MHWWLRFEDKIQHTTVVSYNSKMPDKNGQLAILSEEQLAEYRKNGEHLTTRSACVTKDVLSYDRQILYIWLTYFAGMLALPGFASHQEIAALRQRGQEIVREFDPKQISVFTTEGNKQVGLQKMQPDSLH